jgi:glycosyltransferase involved in cell wall biosynthesis
MPENESVQVSAVVPCRNEVRHVRSFLDSVFRQELGQIKLEVLIADGLSDDGTRQILDEYKSRYATLRVIENPEKIASTALNRAIREAQGEIIIRMDAHTQYAPNYIRSCMEVLNESKADNVGGPVLTRAESYLAQAIAYAFQARFARGGAKFRDPRYEGPVDTVAYGCWRKSTLERIGLFDETLVRSQDYELNVRIVSGGGTVWQSPEIISWYQPRACLSDLFRQYFQYGFWKVAVIRKHPTLASWRNLVPGLCLIVGVASFLGALGMRHRGSVWWSSLFFSGWLTIVALYLMVSFLSAFSIARRKGWRFLPSLPVIFATFHLSFALGFLMAMLYRPAAGARPESMPKVLSAITR